MLVAVAAVALGVVGCSSGDDGGRALSNQAVAAPGESTTTTATSLPPDAFDDGTTTSTSAPPAPLPGLGKGDRGANVAALERKLSELRYFVGSVDDVYDQNTAYAVMAFQKVHGMGRTGRATDEVIAALAAAKEPPPLVPNGGENRVEVDIPRQVLFLYKANTLQKILPISSGNNKRFCSEGWCRRAVTPGGSYGIYRQGRGWEHGPLGSLYNPLYFNGGIAIHGSRSVPAQPASHGCIRIPMSAAEWFPGEVHIGMPVHVYGVDGQPPTPEVTSSTTVTTTTAPSVTAPPTTAASVPGTTPTTAPDLLGGLLKPPT